MNQYNYLEDLKNVLQKERCPTFQKAGCQKYKDQTLVHVFCTYCKSTDRPVEYLPKNSFENMFWCLFWEIWSEGISSGPIDAVWGGAELGQLGNEYAANIFTSAISLHLNIFTSRFGLIFFHWPIIWSIRIVFTGIWEI